jgi:hypothetical protein
MAYELLAFDVADRIATITVNRPDKLNALNDALMAELGTAIEEARRRGSSPARGGHSSPEPTLRNSSTRTQWMARRGQSAANARSVFSRPHPSRRWPP